MKKRVVCRVCGYVMDADKVGDKCPACGVAAKAFQEYTPTMSAKRELWLGFDLHPVVVHFPVAFTVSLFVLAVVYALTGGGARGVLENTVLVLSVCLPFVVIGGVVTGLLDGNVRFKKVTTPLLVRKIVLGAVFFLISIGMILVIIFSSLESLGAWLVFLVCNAGAAVCAALLGLIGKTLVSARMPN